MIGPEEKPVDKVTKEALDAHRAKQDAAYAAKPRYFVRRTITESFEYDPAEVERLFRDGATVPDYLLPIMEGDADVIAAMLTAYDGAICSPFNSREDYDVGHEFYVEDEDGNEVAP